MRSITTFDDQAEALGWAVVHPDGAGGCWADGRGVTTADEAGVDDVAFLRELISWSAATHGTFPDRAIVAGLSNGAAVAHLMGVTASDQVAVIVAVSGGLPERVRDELPAPSHAVSALLIHGTADPISPLAGGYSRHRDRTANCAEATTQEFDAAAETCRFALPLLVPGDGPPTVIFARVPATPPPAPRASPNSSR